MISTPDSPPTNLNNPNHHKTMNTHTNSLGIPYFSKTDESGKTIYSFSEDFTDTWDTETQSEYGSTKPNYRIYDGTGGGGTEDIYAETLEEAKEAGKEWIEDGSWESSDDGIYRTIELECKVREIVRDADGEIDDDATADEWGHDCSGSFADPLPACEVEGYPDPTDDDGHDWVPVTEMGRQFGCRSDGGTAITRFSVCRACGQYKTTSYPGIQRNPDQALLVIEISRRDDESEAWLKETHEEDGWLPDWLAEYLDCSPTVRMTEAEAVEWRDAHGDDETLDREELEHAFAAIIGARPNENQSNGELFGLMN